MCVAAQRLSRCFLAADRSEGCAAGQKMRYLPVRLPKRSRMLRRVWTNVRRKLRKCGIIFGARYKHYCPAQCSTAQHVKASPCHVVARRGLRMLELPTTLTFRSPDSTDRWPQWHSMPKELPSPRARHAVRLTKSLHLYCRL